MNVTYSLHKIEDELAYTFDATGYSRFKFGDTYYARLFAEQLFDGFITEYADKILEQDEVILFPSPYHAIPTASNFLCSYFKDHLNHFLFQHGKSSCVESKIHRKQTYVDDYGNMSFEQRMNLIANDTYYIDRNFVDGKFCIFIDDIKITGSHERTVTRILSDYNVDGDFLFLYFAELVNKNIHPQIENHFNYYRIKSAIDLLDVLNSKHFCFNTRVTKYILLMNNEDFDCICQNLSEVKLRTMFDLAISNNYHQVQEYKHNINQLNEILKWQLTYKKDKEKTLMHQSLQSD